MLPGPVLATAQPWPDASSRERSRAASIAVRNAARTLWSSSWRSAATVVPAGRGDVLAQHRRVLAGLLEHLGRADEGLDHQLVGRRPRQAEQDAGLDHRLDDVEDVRRPGAADRGDRVLVLLGHADDLAHRAQQRLGLGEVLLVAVRAAARSAAMPSSTRAGVLGMTRTTGVPCGQPLLEEVGRDAGRERDDQGARSQVRGDLVQQRAHVLRLDDEDEGVGACGRLDVVDHVDAVALASARRPARRGAR